MLYMAVSPVGGKFHKIFSRYICPIPIRKFVLKIFLFKIGPIWILQKKFSLDFVLSAFDIQVLRPMHPLNLVSVCGYTFTSRVRCGRKYQSRTEGGMGLDKGIVRAGSGKGQMGIR